MLYKIDNSLQMSVNEYQPYAKNMRYIWPSGGESDLEYQSILSRGS